jgi:UDP-glucose 4-epimerase
VAASFADPVDCVRAHVVGTAVVLRCARDAGVRRLVYVSSAEVYGRAELLPVAESAPTLPRSPYGAAKLGAESLVRAWPVEDGLDRVVLRPFSVYGAGVAASSLVGTVMRAAATAEAVTVRSLDTVRDYVHVTDVASAIRLALAHPDVADAPVFNVGSGVGTPVQELVRAALLGARRDVPLLVSGDGDRPGSADLPVLVADTRHAAERLGWRASLTLRDGIAGALRALR